MEKFILNVADEIFCVLNFLDENYKGISRDFGAPIGKGIRARFAYYLGKIFELKKNISLNIAVSAELVHLASLLHDDCIDGSKYRRNRPTLNSKYGTTLAVLSGDFIVAFAFKKADAVSHSLSLSLVDCVLSMIKGAIIEESIKYKIIDVKKYIEIVHLKTSELFKWIIFGCGYLGGYKDFERLKKIAYNFGLSFQIIDDVIDIEAESSNIGEDVMKDIVEGKFTYPVIIAMENDAIKKKINDFLTHKDDLGLVYEIRRDIINNSYTQKSRDYALRLVEEIKDDIFRLGEAETASQLYGFIYSTVFRKY